MDEYSENLDPTNEQDLRTIKQKQNQLKESDDIASDSKKDHLTPSLSPASSSSEYFGYSDRELDPILSPDTELQENSSHYFNHSTDELDSILLGKSAIPLSQAKKKSKFESKNLSETQPHQATMPPIPEKYLTEEQLQKIREKEYKKHLEKLDAILNNVKTQDPFVKPNSPDHLTPTQQKSPSMARNPSSEDTDQVEPAPPKSDPKPANERNNEQSVIDDPSHPQKAQDQSKKQNPKHPPLSPDDILEVLGQPTIDFPPSWHDRTKAEVSPPATKQTTGTNYYGKRHTIPDYSVSRAEQQQVENYLRAHNPASMTEDDQKMIAKGHIYVLFPVVAKSSKPYFGETSQTSHNRLQGHMSTGRHRVVLNNKKEQGLIKEAEIAPKYKTHLAYAMAKHGPSNFYMKKIHSVKNINKLTMQRLEGYYMVKYNTLNRTVGYNMRIGGSGGFNTEEQNKKTSQTLQGHSVSEEQKMKTSKTMQGRPSPMKDKTQTPEHTEKIKNKNTGKKRSEKFKKEQSDRISGSNHPNWGQKLPEKHCENISKGRLEANIRGTVPQNDMQNSTKEIKFFADKLGIKKDIIDIQADIQKIKEDLHEKIIEGKTTGEICDHFKIPQNSVRNFLKWSEGNRNLSEIRKKFNVKVIRKTKNHNTIDINSRNAKISKSSTKFHDYQKITKKELEDKIKENLAHRELLEHFYMKSYHLKKLLETHYGESSIVKVRKILKVKKKPKNKKKPK